jgi:hypothetical protein
MSAVGRERFERAGGGHNHVRHAVEQALVDLARTVMVAHGHGIRGAQMFPDGWNYCADHMIMARARTGSVPVQSPHQLSVGPGVCVYETNFTANYFVASFGSPRLRRRSIFKNTSIFSLVAVHINDRYINGICVRRPLRRELPVSDN